MNVNALVAAHYSALGYTCVPTETYDARARVRRDLLGFIDFVCLGDGVTIGVQATSGSNHAKRRTKIHGECRAAAITWLRAGNEIELISWRTADHAARVERITLESLDAA